MILDAQSEPIPAVVRADVAVVGAGPAGITLALELSSKGLDVVVLESGGVDHAETPEAMLEATVSGEDDYPVVGSRLRAFGGTSAIWAGRSHPLEPLELGPRSWVPESGWPFGNEELDRWYPRAQEIIEIGPEPFDLETWRPTLTEHGYTSVIETQRLRTMVFRASHITFGERYHDDLADLANVTVWLNANVVNIETNAAGTVVEALDVATLDGHTSRIEATEFVLAAGALETARLLLSSDDVHPGGIGNEHDLVGRYFMEHPHFTAGTLVLDEWFAQGAGSDLYLFGANTVTDRPSLVGQVALRPEVVADEELLASTASISFVLDTPPYFDRAEAVRSLYQDAEQTIGNTYGLFLHAEQIPHPDNRVTLADSTDPLGMARLHLHWQPTDIDRASYARTARIFAEELGAAGLGRVQSWYDVPDAAIEYSGGHHHMGTTRMHEDPTRGVVDPDLRVHGLDNLFVASSAAFPTGGAVNPTMTIVALAARLADHLAP